MARSSETILRNRPVPIPNAAGALWNRRSFNQVVSQGMAAGGSASMREAERNAEAMSRRRDSASSLHPATKVRASANVRAGSAIRLVSEGGEGWIGVICIVVIPLWSVAAIGGHS